MEIRDRSIESKIVAPTSLRAALRKKVLDPRDQILACVSILLYLLGIEHHIGSIFSIVTPKSLWNQEKSWNACALGELKIYIDPFAVINNASGKLIFDSPCILVHRKWGLLVPVIESGIRYLLSPTGGGILFRPEMSVDLVSSAKIEVLGNKEFYFDLLRPDPRKVPILYLCAPATVGWQYAYEQDNDSTEKTNGDYAPPASSVDWSFLGLKNIESLIDDNFCRSLFSGIREINLARFRVKFCPFMELGDYLLKINEVIQEFVFSDCVSPMRLAWLYSDFNCIHPFNDGNGRFGIELINGILKKRALCFDRQLVEGSAWYYCAYHAALGDARPLARLIERCISGEKSIS